MRKSRQKGAQSLREVAIRTLWATWVLLLLAPGPLVSSGAETDRDGFGHALDDALRVPALSGAKISALVVRASDGATLWALSPDLPLIPASNMKLLTSLALLEMLGPTHQFETRVRADRRPGSDGVVGELTLQGGGDPALTSEALWRLAADLRLVGVTRVDGDLIVDDSAFDGAFWHPSWGAVSSRAYHAPVGALSANYGAYFVRISPAKEVGAPPIVILDPPVDYLELTNRSRTTASKEADALRVVRGRFVDGREEVIVGGGIRKTADPAVFARSVKDPALYAGALLKHQLEGLGIEVKGKVRRGTSKGGVELLDFKSPPLSEIVKLTLKYSNNAISETLVKAAAMQDESGDRGSWERGVPLLRARLLETGVISEEAVMVDGSGLSTGNRLSARMLVRALERARSSFRIGPEMGAALPISARDGTLEDRLAPSRDRVRAKTGLLGDARVVALSGLIESDTGEERIFSILVNGYKGSSLDAMAAIDVWASSVLH